MTVYAVTGASGHLGRLAVQELLACGVPPSDVVAVVRSRAKAESLAMRGVQIREADYSRPDTLFPALAGVDRLLLVSSSHVGQRVVHHTNVIEAAKVAGISRILYTSLLNAGASTGPFAAEHLESERVIGGSGVPFTLLRNSFYTEVYTNHLSEYLQAGEIVGAAGNGRISAAVRQDFAAAAAAALLQDTSANRTYELGGPAFDLSQLAQTISEVTGTQVSYRDLAFAEYVDSLQQDGMDQPTAEFVAAIDVSTARGDLETKSHELEELLGRQAVSLSAAVRAAYGLDKVRSRTATIGFIGAGRIGGTVAKLAVDAGYKVVLSNSRGPETLVDLLKELGPHARAGTPSEAGTSGDIVVVTIPFKGYAQVPVEPLAGKPVIDTTNYFSDRDGHIAELDDESTTSSELLQAHLSASHVIKALNTVYFGHLATLSRPQGASDRSALAIAGNDELAKQTAGAFLDAIGFDAYDMGPLSEGWRFQANATPYVYSTDGSFEHQAPASTARLTSLLAQAKRYRDM